MTPRERVLAVILVIVIVFGGGGFFGYQFVYQPWKARKANLDRLQKEEKDKLERRAELEKQRTRLARWTSLSLPGDQETARLEYERYLTKLFNDHKITNGREIKQVQVDAKNTPTVGPNKEPVYTKLAFEVKTYATMANLVALMDEFYRTGLVHEIKRLSIQRQGTVKQDSKPDELDVRMTVEALIITGADKRPYLLPNFDRRLLAIDAAAAVFNRGPMLQLSALSPGRLPTGQLARPDADYGSIAHKNIFLGRPPKEGPRDTDGSPMWMAPRFVYLDDITQSPLRMQGVLYDRLHNVNYKLRESGTYTTFPMVRDGRAEHFLDGHVIRIDDRKVYYHTELAVPEGGFGGAPFVVRPEKSELDKLVAEKVISAEDAKRVVRYDGEYWEALLRTKVLKAGFDRNRFTVELDRDSDTPVSEDEGGGGSFEAPPKGNPVEVLKGKVVLREDGYVYALPEERYYELHLGESIDDSLQRKPLSAGKVKELKDLAAN